ncbi:diguanylate cyclase domain-containing protein [Aestuariirhabdus litorea]|uniref:diguanylate cyclase n=1 Tax=Aestuariirhabdus litorea TaxID=2528527 RepID=A0A3P3VQ91_9GAMM|nr:diguanylate cyclase [Aestuariirhabdus litorea]RRJ82983.1 diguanylate cyclase [Aestuariirhabdus litorea]RWW93143.1 diguanylate cyclase [Endozoicomonadaceae bacterium GTF-13]
MVKEKQSVLIIEDEEVNIRVLGQILSREFNIDVATCGRDALVRAEQDEMPDLILLDVTMPDIDGYELCRQLSDNEKTRHIPIILITSEDQEKQEAYGLSLGAVDYIVKPFSVPVLVARVRTHLQLKRQRDMLSDLSVHDSLTGLYNRRKFDGYIEAEWRRACRNQTSLALVMLDVDLFKAYNDHYGHMAGDRCLQRIADCLLANIQRSGDLLARYGGEEFVAVLPELDRHDATVLAQKLCDAVAALTVPHAASTVADHVTLSGGVAAMVPDIDMPSSQLIEAADSALYAAKKAGRDCVQVYVG